MKEVRITDAELQALIAPALRERLKAEGFHTGRSEAEHACVFLPVNLDMAGALEIERTEDGVWCFRQELNAALSERTEQARASHAEASIKTALSTQS